MKTMLAGGGTKRASPESLAGRKSAPMADQLGRECHGAGLRDPGAEAAHGNGFVIPECPLHTFLMGDPVTPRAFESSQQTSVPGHLQSQAAGAEAGEGMARLSSG